MSSSSCFRVRCLRDRSAVRRTCITLVVSSLFAVLASACSKSSSSASTPTTPTTPATGPAVTLTPAALTFITPLPTAPQTATLTNSGTEALTITSVVASGNFVETDNCVGTFDVGAGCTITVNYAVTGIGSSGTVTITDNASTSPQTVTLGGPTATAPADQFSPPSLTFGSQPVGTSSAAQTVTVTNPVNGLSAPLAMSSVVTIGDFAIANNACGGSLAPGASCTISVIFKPTVAGPLTGLLAVFDNAANPEHGVTLSGTGQ
jgi:hypothetical protein